MPVCVGYRRPGWNCSMSSRLDRIIVDPQAPNRPQGRDSGCQRPPAPVVARAGRGESRQGRCLARWRRRRRQRQQTRPPPHPRAQGRSSSRRQGSVRVCAWVCAWARSEKKFGEILTRFRNSHANKCYTGKGHDLKRYCKIAEDVALKAGQ